LFKFLFGETATTNFEFEVKDSVLKIKDDSKYPFLKLSEEKILYHKNEYAQHSFFMHRARINNIPPSLCSQGKNTNAPSILRQNT
jgi:hypothetical protein